MASYFLLAGCALLLALSATPLVRRLAVHLGIVDRPAARKIHTRPIPLMGGVAIYAAFIISLLLLGDKAYVRETVGIFVGASLCSLVGLWDDRRGLSALSKLLAQALAATILVISGVQVRLPLPGVLNLAITALWVVGVTNAMNLLDNMDGLAGGVGAVAAAFFVLLAAMSGQYLVGALAASLLGACIGFLVYNVNPASVFMGDSGALFLGFILAAVGIKLRFPSNSPFVTWMIPVMVLAIPLFDTSLVFVSRLRRRLNPLTTPGKDHVSHRLVALGYTQREAVLVIYVACCVVGIAAMYVTQATVVEGHVLAAGLLLSSVVLAWRLERRAPIGLSTSVAQNPSPSRSQDPPKEQA
jgi:UDP-GlcNAc:undecaprenyl-phosphate GlcNAc-1-phosphate transferase